MTKLPEKMDFPGSMLFRKAKLITNIDFVFTQAGIAIVLGTKTISCPESNEQQRQA